MKQPFLIAVTAAICLAGCAAQQPPAAIAAAAPAHAPPADEKGNPA